MTQFKKFLWILFGFCIAFQVVAQQKTEINRQEIAALYQQLSIEQQQFEISQTKLADLKKIREQQLNSITAKEFNKELLAKAKLNLAIAQADLLATNQSIQEIQDNLTAIKTLMNRLTERLQEIRVAQDEVKGKNDKILVLQNEIDYQQSLYNLQMSRLNLLNKTQRVAAAVVKLEQAWVTKLMELDHEHQNQLREDAIQELATTSQKESKYWLEKLAGFNQQLQAYNAEQRFTNSDAILLSVNIFHAQESVYVSRLRLDVAKLQDAVEDLGNTIQKSMPLSEIDKLQTVANQLIKQADQMNQQIVAKQKLLDEQLNISRQSRDQGIITEAQLQQQLSLYSSLIKDYSQIIATLTPIRKEIAEDKAVLQKALNEAIGRRQGLPGFELQAWLTLFKNVSHIPVAIWGLFGGLADQISVAFATMSWPWILTILLSEMLWIGLWMMGRRFAELNVKTSDETSQPITINTSYVFLKLLQENSISILLIGVILLLFVMSGVPYQSYRILIYLAVVWFAYRAINDLARFTLLESVLHTSGHDVWLYHRLKWVFRLGAVITALTILVNELNAAYNVRDFFNRLFMLFLLTLSIVLFRARKVVPTLMKPYTEQSRPYVRRLIALMSTLIPLTLLSNAVTGLIGYVQLAWVMSYYQAIFLLVIAVYIIIRGLLIDLISFISDLSIRYLQNGWLWSQAFLKPLDRIVRIFAAIVAIFILFYAYGWNMQSMVVKSISAFLYHPIYLFTAMGSTITLASTIEFIILVAVVFWAARWTREFGYRWAFINVRDLGLRNSLAVFSQYIMITIGAVFTLRVLGLDVSGLSYILGGLAVGLGFGLRDFANNIVSGVMMLIERPIREGDIVTVGDFEGTITHMGIRSSMLKSWDNMEVLIPNSEIFNKVFTNWTLQDNTVRTVINLNIHRRDDVVKITQLIHDVLSKMPQLLKDPEPQVYVDEVNNVFIEIEVRYFINVHDHSRAQVRSDVLLAIMDLFKQHNILPPYPQQDVRLLQKGELNNGD